MPVDRKILDAIPGDVRCQNCGCFVEIGKGKTLGFWHEGQFLLFCSKCENVALTFDFLRGCKQERI